MALKILILTHHFSPHTETFIYNDAVALSEWATVKIACFHRQNQQLRPFDNVEELSFQRSWVMTKIYNLAYKFNFRLNYKNSSLSQQLKALLVDYQPDVIHLHFGIQALYFLDNLQFAGPIVITFHGYDATKLVKKSAIYRKRLRHLFDMENVFPLATSASLFSYMAQYQIESSRSRVLYSGIDVEFFKPTTRSYSSPFFTFTQISSFQPKKGHVYLLEAFSKLVQKYPGKKFRLILAGGGYLLETIQAKAEELGISDMLQFEGWITPEQAVEILQRTNVFVHPSVTPEDGNMESTTVAILEAMAMELPIFATFHSGIPEIVRHGINGLLANEKDVDGYVSCMEQLIKWDKLPHNREKIKKDFSHQAHITKLLTCYQRAIRDLS